MYVKAIIILCCVICVLLLYLFLRGRANGNGVSNNKDIINGLKDSTGTAREVNKKSTDITSDIEHNNTKARGSIDNALDILENAKNRSNT